MKFEEIAALSGKGGLFRVVSSNKGAIILESLDAARTKLVVSHTSRLSILSEISLYTTSREGTVPLKETLHKIYATYGTDLGLDGEASAEELRAFVKSVVPDYDTQRVYVSDMKKLIKWYQILAQHAPGLLVPEVAADNT